MNNSNDTEIDHDINRIVQTYSNMLFRIAFVILCNEHDTEDALQNTYYKYIQKQPLFHDSEHEKAWLIRVLTNCCRDMRRFKLKHTHINIEEISECYYIAENAEILESIMNLPIKYKTAIHLFYFENYSTEEIAKILNISSAAVRKRLQYARQLLKIEFQKEGIV